MEQHNEFKSPVAALLWSLTMAGFGQFYNGQYIFGFILLMGEFTANVLSNLNLTIHHTFHGDYLEAHRVANYQWGLFYPSIYGFSIWQAYNEAIIFNYRQEGKKPPRETYLTGFCIGLVVGMNFGIYWHHHFWDEFYLIRFLTSPVYNGLVLGMTGGLIGHLIEKWIKSREIKREMKNNKNK
ncbi:hypothetical protein [Oceanobacillus massiliensis]|uniref:hypothetical protein n=1 Tax=Oceanobacillus massiliensis TaxID=1465765 RepID=UPI0005CB5BB6|nr:hypothetical protein [Oceanobacillus massiliensis]